MYGTVQSTFVRLQSNVVKLLLIKSYSSNYSVQSLDSFSSYASCKTRTQYQGHIFKLRLLQMEKSKYFIRKMHTSERLCVAQHRLQNKDTINKKHVHSCLNKSQSHVNYRALIECNEHPFSIQRLEIETTSPKTSSSDSLLSLKEHNNDMHRLHCSSPVVSQSNEKNTQLKGKPSEDQLIKIKNALTKDLKSIFTKSMDFRVYSKDIIFENRINGTTTAGISSYWYQSAMLRMMGHVKFAFVEFEILKITHHTDDATIRVRWRIVGSSGLRSIFKIWNQKKYNLSETKKNFVNWYDGFSIFYVGNDGLVYKHVADKMMPDDQVNPVQKLSLSSRIAAMLGLIPKTPDSAITNIKVSKNKFVSSLPVEKKVVSLDLDNNDRRIKLDY